MTHTDEYIQIIDHVYNTYFDSIYGFHLQMAKISEHENSYIENLQTNSEKTQKIHELSSKPLNYAIAGNIVVSSTHGEAKKRNWPDDGSNYQWAAKMALVTIYEFWEEKYRALIAIERGLSSKDELKINEFGELGYFRNAILHKLGVATDHFKRTKVFTWFKPGEKIFLDTEKIDFMIGSLKRALL